MTWGNWPEICDFVPKPWFVRGVWLGEDGKPLPTDQTNFIGRGDSALGLIMRTLESEEFLASGGDWIIKGVAGEFYPCKPDIFAATYEPVEDPLADCIQRHVEAHDKIIREIDMDNALGKMGL